MGLLTDRKYAQVGSNLIEVNLANILLANKPINLILRGFFEVELLVNNSSIKKEQINIWGTYKVKGISKDISSNNSLIVIVTVDVNPLKWESFEYKLEVNGQNYNLIN